MCWFQIGFELFDSRDEVWWRFGCCHGGCCCGNCGNHVIVWLCDRGNRVIVATKFLPRQPRPSIYPSQLSCARIQSPNLAVKQRGESRARGEGLGIRVEGAGMSGVTWPKWISQLEVNLEEKYLAVFGEWKSESAWSILIVNLWEFRNHVTRPVSSGLQKLRHIRWQMLILTTAKITTPSRAARKYSLP